MPPRRAAKIAASLQRLASSAPDRPLVCWAMSQVDVVAQRLVGGVDVEDPLAALDVGRRDEDLTVEAARAQQRRVELLEQVGRRHDDDAARGREAVHLDQQLVERLLALGVVVGAAAAPTASSSSMKMIAGSCLRASRNSRRMRAAPRPANISTNDEADCE